MTASASTLIPAVDRSKRSPRLRTSKTLVAIPGIAEGGTASLLNLSTTGACVELEDYVEKGQSLDLKFAHPSLGVVPSLSGEVMWIGMSDQEKLQAGLRFADPSLASDAVRPFMTAEAGSCVLEEGTLVGFLVPHGKAQKTFSVFDASGTRLAVATRDEAGFAVQPKIEQAGPLPSIRARSLFEAVCKSIGVNDPLKLQPKISGWRGEARIREEPQSAPALPLKADSASVELVTLNSLEAQSPRPATVKARSAVSGETKKHTPSRDTKTRPTARATGKLTKRGHVNRLGRVSVGVAVLAMLSGLVYGFGLLVRAYTS